MRLRSAVALVVISLISVVFIKHIKVEAGVLSSSWLQPQDKACKHIKPFYYGIMEKCLEDGKVADKNLHDCSKLHSQGNCKPGEILVFRKDPCLQTKCVENIDSSGTACEEGWYNFNGTCREAGYLGCGGEFGRRVRPDLFGDVQCVCDQQLGFVELDGECYFEFLQGPCEPGEQLIVDIEGTLQPECVVNTCDTAYAGFMISGTIHGTENICSSIDSFSEKYNKSLMTREEKAIIEIIAPLTGTFENCNKRAAIAPLTGTFENCNKRAAKTGDCLETEPEPTLGPPETFMNEIKKEFNLTGATVEEESENRIDNETLFDVELENSSKGRLFVFPIENDINGTLKQ